AENRIPHASNNDVLPAHGQAEILAALRDGTLLADHIHGEPGGKPQHIETHCSHIFLINDRAFKLKQPIAFSYLAYGTLAARERSSKAELELNRRTAPQLFLGCHKIIRRTDGGLALAAPTDAAPALDWLLEMKRFPDDGLLADRADKGQLTPALMR